MTKVAIKKTTGVLGDDLALSAQQIAGVTADRELPVVWAVAKGSLKNKLLLVPAALVISAFAPLAITPLLMFGGIFLCFEGFEKLAHGFTHGKGEDQAHHDKLVKALSDPHVDIVAFEKEKVRGAIRTDFILSAEIIVITLGAVAEISFGSQVAVLVGMAFIMTLGVYGLVAGIVKLDDGGLYLSRKRGENWLGNTQRVIGAAVLRAAPYLMKGLSIAGMVAMFMVGGSILEHGLPGAHDLLGSLTHWAPDIPGIGPLMGLIAPLLLNALFGLFAGAIAVGAITVFGRVRFLQAKH